MDAKIVSLWGAIIVSLVALITFTGALIVAFYVFLGSTHDASLLQLTVGAAIANATTAIGFWLGSSSGSQKKDEVIGAALRASTGSAAPVVTAISPKSGGVAGGVTVTVTGSGFTSAISVQFGGNDASSMTLVSDTQITATSPPGAAGAVDVTVLTPAGTSAISLADKFTYLLAQN
jgi:hypothetical protein